MSIDRPKPKFLTVDDEYGGQRLDNYLLRELKGVPRSLIYRIVRSGEVRINKGRVAVSHRVQSGDLIRIPPLRRGQAAVAGAPSDSVRRVLSKILFEDDDLLVLDKAAGMAVHGGSGISLGLIEGLRKLRPDDRYLELVHRLDRDTSGCLLIAKRASVLRSLHKDLRQTGTKRIKKNYLALLSGGGMSKRNEVCVPLRKYESKSGERLVRVSEADGRYSKSVFRVIEHFANAVLVDIELVTGRTHQARIHAAHLGHPIVGDTKYGDKGMNAAFKTHGISRLFLHAHRLQFVHPKSNKKLVIESPLPSDLAQCLEML